jgi:uncharacterized membrane protein
MPTTPIAFSILSGYHKDWRKLVKETREYLSSISSPLGPFPIEDITEDIFGFVAQNGFGSSAMDLHILEKIDSLVFSFDVVSSQVIVVNSNVGACHDPYVKKDSSKEKMLQFVASKLEDPTQWIFVIQNKTDIIHNQPERIYARKIIDNNLAIIDPMFVVEDNKSYVEGFSSPMDSIETIDIKQFIERIKDPSKDIISKLDSILAQMEDSENQSLELFSLEYGPVKRIFLTAASTVVFVTANRSTAVSKLYNEDEYLNVVRRPSTLFPNASISWLSSEIEYMKVEVEHSCSKCNKCDYQKQDIKKTASTPLTSADSFFS